MVEHGPIVGASAGELVGSVRDLLRTGGLHPGDTLPPIRSLADSLGVNRNTVAAAYGQLAAAGIVETRRRGGTVILGLPALDGEGRGARSGLVNLASGNPDPDLLPDLRDAMREPFAGSLYGAEPILAGLRDWSAAHLSPDVAADHGLVLTHGAVDAVERILAASLTRGDTVAVEDPCFLSSIGILRLGGYATAPVPVDDEGMTVEGLTAALRAGARAVVLTPRAHNPTGAGLTPERADALRTVLADHPGVLVVEDDHFSAISVEPYLRATPPSTARWALVRSVSKFLGPDLRVALVLSDPDTTARLGARLGPATTWVSHILQHLTHRLLTDDRTPGLLDRARSEYARRNLLLADALRAQGLPAPDRTDGLNAWIPVVGDPTRITTALADRGWAVRPGADFAIGERPTSAVRVTTSTLTPDQAAAFAADLSAVLDA